MKPLFFHGTSLICVIDAKNAFLGNRYVSLPALDDNAGTIADIAPFRDIDGKAAYLDWVAQYKAFINEASAVSRHLRSEMKSDCDDTRTQAQEARSFLRGTITRAIHLRRLGKTWSRAQAQKRLAAAA